MGAGVGWVSRGLGETYAIQNSENTIDFCEKGLCFMLHFLILSWCLSEQQNGTRQEGGNLHHTKQ